MYVNMKVIQYLGFHPKQLLTWKSFIQLLYQPCDPASLAVTRIMFGVLMLLDIPQERGMGTADYKWGDPYLCHFPLFDVVKPLPLQWMILLYSVMIFCTIMMIIGWKWRISCGIFVLSYWFLFLLDRSTWNNHSYLYGLLASILLFSDPHRCWSVDSMRNHHLRNSHVPLWNYALLRAQIFFLYFLAGIKKIDKDWLLGYSVKHLSEHWVFFPFRLIFSNENIDYYIVHLGGFTFDLTVGFLLFTDATRKLAMFFGSAFNLMNSQIFTIGMFPWVCLATMPIFCDMSWPRSLVLTSKEYLRSIRNFFHSLIKMRLPLQVCKTKLINTSKVKKGCTMYVNSWICKNKKERMTLKENDSESQIAELDKSTATKVIKESLPSSLQRNPHCFYEDCDNSVTWQHRLTALLILLHLALQLFMPFSHFITKGYNTWTEGPYGYSWDMMVHSWDNLHIKITGVMRESQEKFYINPAEYSMSNRWASHADMAVQFGHCIEERMKKYGLDNFTLHFDVWKSLNFRFQQRIYDPNVDILQAPWSPWDETPWVLPLLSELNTWRERLHELHLKQSEISPDSDSIFIADFPGLMFDNFIHKDLSNITLEVLQGEVTIFIQTVPDNIIDKSLTICNEFINNFEESHIRHRERVYAVVLKTGEKYTLPSNVLHTVMTTSEGASCIMYTFINSTLVRTVNERLDEKSLPEDERSTSQLRKNENDSGETCKNTPWFLSPKAFADHVETQGAQASNRHKATTVTDGNKYESNFPTWNDFKKFANWKIETFTRCIVLLSNAWRSVITGVPMQ